MKPRHSHYDVWARVVWAVLDGAERGGFDTGALLAGLPFDASSVRRLGRIDWEHYVEIVERVYARFDRPEDFETFVENTYHRVFPEASAIARALVSPAMLIRAITEIADAILFPPIEFHFQHLGDERVRVHLRLRSGARPSLAFFRGNVGGYRGATRHLALPSARVVADVSAEHALLDITLPRSGTIAARARQSAQRALSGAFRLVLGATPVGDPISTTIASCGDDLGVAPRVDMASRKYALTPRQAEVLECLTQGMANKEIAQALGCAEVTIEAHVTKLLQKVGVDSRAQLISRFWSGP